MLGTHKQITTRCWIWCKCKVKTYTCISDLLLSQGAVEPLGELHGIRQLAGDAQDTISLEHIQGYHCAATTTVTALHFQAHGSQRRWGELWMVELLAELRRDSDTGVAMAAYSQFCFFE